jgi:hypothetical protein
LKLNCKNVAIILIALGLATYLTANIVSTGDMWVLGIALSGELLLTGSTLLVIDFRIDDIEEKIEKKMKTEDKQTRRAD